MLPTVAARQASVPPRLRSVLLVVLGVTFVLCTAWLDGGAGILPNALWRHPAWIPWWSPPLRMLCNALPGLLLAFALTAWTRRAGASFALAFGVEALLYGANALKMHNLAIPLLPADFQMLGQLGHGGGELLAGYLPHPWLLALAVLAAVAMLVAAYRVEPALWPRRPRRARAASALVLCVLLGTLVAGLAPWRSVYNAKRLEMQPWAPQATRQHDGLVAALLLFHLQYGSTRRQPDTKTALALMARYEPTIAHARAAAPATSDKPDIVVILSESFFDPSILRGWPADADLIPNVHRLQQHATSGWLHVPTFGGGTIRTEFEVLTGLSLRYFPDVQFPYLQIHQKRIPGIVCDLAADGYMTLAVHGNNPGFWNRTTAFKELGFDKFISIGDFPRNDASDDGKYMSDKAFTDELLRQLPAQGPPRFVLGISIEAHGPYDHDYGIDTRARGALPVPASITDPQARRELQNYLYHIHDADAQLGRLVQVLAQRKRRTLILFFGDHLPALVPAFQQAGFKDGGGFLTQCVPYLLIDTANLEHPVRENAAAWTLPGMLLQKAGLDRDNYLALTRLVGPQLAALTRAPDAPAAPEDPAQRRLDEGLRNVAALRLANKLYKLWPQAARSAEAVTLPRSGAARP